MHASARRDGAGARAFARRIGPIGTAVRAFGGLGLIYLAGAADGLPWDVDWYDPIVGFVALPLIMVAVGLGVRRHASRPIRLTGPLGIALNGAVIVVLASSEYTAAGAILFYGASMLVAAWVGQSGCETTVVPNLLLSRDDQIGCPTLFLLDEAEARRARAVNRRSVRRRTRSRWPGSSRPRSTSALPAPAPSPAQNRAEASRQTSAR
jgi:hypothetical protein